MLTSSVICWHHWVFFFFVLCFWFCFFAIANCQKILEIGKNKAKIEEENLQFFLNEWLDEFQWNFKENVTSDIKSHIKSRLHPFTILVLRKLHCRSNWPLSFLRVSIIEIYSFLRNFFFIFLFIFGRFFQ